MGLFDVSVPAGYIEIFRFQHQGQRQLKYLEEQSSNQDMAGGGADAYNTACCAL